MNGYLYYTELNDKQERLDIKVLEDIVSIGSYYPKELWAFC